MRSLILAILLLAASPSWPNTPAGAMARDWVQAFASEPAMRAFLVKNVTEEGLRERTIEERIETYRESKKKFVTLQLGSVVSSKSDQLKAKLVAKNGKSYEFTFTVQRDAPHKLVSITRTETRAHGFFGH